MEEDYRDIELQDEEMGNAEGVEEQDDGLVGKTGDSDAERFGKLINDGEQKYKLSGMFKDWFLDYASYVILERAVPHIDDGLKPVQRRILHAMKKGDNGKLHKVAGIAGDTMKYHPHGDASIKDALVQLGQKGLMITCQGNWGNIITGDSAAAGRYIEAKLSEFALEVAFNSKITEWVPSYDGESLEPVNLPMKFPLLLAQGAEGIAVGLASKILPHNFNELLDASICALRGEEFTLYPDFPTGGLADCTRYNGGMRGGQVKVRARIEKLDKHTLVITEVPFGVTTDDLRDSIVKASDAGKIKIRKVEDNTSSKARVVVTLNNDISPDKTIDALYAFTSCEVSVNPNSCVIMDGKPHFMPVEDILRYNAAHTRDLFKRELEIVLDELESDWHFSSLEKIFFERKIFRILENDAKTWEDQLDDVTEGMMQYQDLLRRPITRDDILRLVEKPVRKISRFDIKAAEERIRGIEKKIADVKHNLKHLTEYTIDYFNHLKEKYGAAFPRQTEITSFEAIQATKVVANNAKLYINREEGFIGTQLKKDDQAEYVCDCSDIDDIIVFLKSGKYIITKISPKAFVGKKIIHAAVFNRNDSRTVYNAVYRDGRGGTLYAKRFAVTGITKDKEYDLTQGKPDSSVVWLTANPNGEAEVLKIFYKPKPKLKKLVDEYDFAQLAIKGRSSRGNILTRNLVARIQLKSKGVSTIGGKNIWFDTDIARLNEDGRGVLLGEFVDGEHILAICKDGTFYTTSFDLSNRFQGELLRVEKLDTGKTWSALYWDNDAKAFYIKRFPFEVSDNMPQSFISEAKGSYLLEISDDAYPQLELTFGGRNEGRPNELIDVEDYIGRKSFKAKGRKVTYFETSAITFAEPLEKEAPESPDIPEDIPDDIPDDIPEDIPEDIPADTPDIPGDDGLPDFPDDEEAIELTLF